MSKVISFDLSPSSIRGARQELVRYKSTLDKVTEEIVLALLKVGKEYAMEQLLDLDAAYTQNLMNSIETEIDGKIGYIFTNLDYAKFVEYGTGIVGQYDPHPYPPSGWVYDSNAHGVEGWWYYNENDGQVHWTQGMKHRPFMYNTARELDRNKKQIAKEVLKK